MGDSYLGIISIFQLLRDKGLISKQEYEKCIEELYKSWEYEKDSVISETQHKGLKS